MTGTPLSRDSNPADTATNTRILVPVSDSSTMRETVRYAVEQALEQAEDEKPAYILFAAVEPLIIANSATHTYDELLNRVAAWAAETSGVRSDQLHVETVVLGTDEHVFSPEDVATVLRDAVIEAEMHRILLDPEYDPGIDMPALRSLETEITKHTDVACDVAPVTQRVKRSIVQRSMHRGAFIATAGIMFLFYQVLAGALDLFNVVTGAATALAAAAAFSRLQFTASPTMATPVRIVRFCVYFPVLVGAIIGANLHVAKLILHPKMPIDPKMMWISPEMDRSLPLTVLANSITLTPGTLTTVIDGTDMLIHTLDTGSREDLQAGTLQRWVRYVFHGTDTGGGTV